MKNVVTLDEIREIEIRPREVFFKYFDLLKEDVPRFFAEKSDEERRHCPACESPDFTDEFEKLGFQYRSCDSCGTMYVARRASDESLDRYYRESDSHRFFVTEFLNTPVEKNDRRMIEKRIDWILDSMAEYECPAEVFLDQRSKYPRLLRAIEESVKFSKYYYSRPLLTPDALGGGAFAERSPLREHEDGSISVLTAFDFLDTLFNPGQFFQDARRTLQTNGLLFLTSRCISGLDMQVLWGESRSIMPPQHVTIFSVEGLVKICEAHGFTIRELSTPGQLDLDIIANASSENPNLELPRFIKYLLDQRDANAHHSFKEFIQRHRLSSYVRLVLQKT